MKKYIMLVFLAGFFTFSVSSCREQKSEEKQLIEEMENKDADVKVSEDGKKLKMKTDDKKVKIKKDDEGKTKKIKVKNKD